MPSNAIKILGITAFLNTPSNNNLWRKHKKHWKIQHFLEAHRTKTLGIPIFLKGPSTKMLENPALLDAHRMKTRGIPVLLNDQSTKTLENPAF